MAIAIINNDHSFIQFNAPDSFMHCVFGEIRQCLPVINPDDIAFQFVVTADSPAEADDLCEAAGYNVDVQLVRHCNDSAPIIEFGAHPTTFRINTNQIAYDFNSGFPGFPYDLKPNECFYIRIKIDDVIKGCSNCLQRITDECFTSVVEYGNEDDAFGFEYCGDPAFMNRVRLPFYLSKPQFPAERNVFRKANGAAQVLSVVIRKTMQGITDYLNELWHQRLMIALNHDHVNVYSETFTGSVVMDGEYQIAWNDFLNLPVAQATFQMQITPFEATNTNCQTCETDEAINVENDFISDMIGDGDTASINVTANDVILCCPHSFVLTFINPDFVDVASIDPSGLFEFTAVPTVPTATNVKIATYKVSCADGSFKEANIYASFTGSGAAVCCDPYGIIIDPVINRISWNIDCLPANGFIIEIFTVSDPVVPVLGSVAPGTQHYFDLPFEITSVSGNYIFKIHSRCETVDGNPVSYPFTILTTVTAVYAAFGDTIIDACNLHVPVYLSGGTTITAGVTVYLEPALINKAPGIYISDNITYEIRTLLSGVVGGTTGMTCV